MSDAITLARTVIDKYGADADKPSVHLAKALIDGAHERDRLRAEVDRLTLEHRRHGQILSDVNEAIGRAGIHCAITLVEALDRIREERDSLRAEVERMRPVYEAAKAWRHFEGTVAVGSLVNPVATLIATVDDATKEGL